MSFTMGKVGLKTAKSFWLHYGDFGLSRFRAATTAGLESDQGPRKRPKTLLPYIQGRKAENAKSFGPYIILGMMRNHQIAGLCLGIR